MAKIKQGHLLLLFFFTLLFLSAPLIPIPGCRAEGRNEAKMIGSTAPTCTYNECRGCKFKCSAQQVPVEANDPINTAYYYKCVCHRS
ncbi:hypothetical protein V6N12_053856 [Hibiscus sabdariffa]|uniref:Stomagen C-terminal domain-containing protein n=1 Tax=Hibiscus sabdariffa TaxID=183260 RepID=A0ABR2D8T0_9ROSI